jgi:hypothetical protein
MMRPYLAASMGGRQMRLIKKAPVRFTPMTAFQSSSDSSVKAARLPLRLGLMAALFTSTCTRL